MMCLLTAMGPTQAMATYADVWSYINWESVSIEFTGSGSYTSTIETYAYAESADSAYVEDNDFGSSTDSMVESVAEFHATAFWGWGLYDREDLYAEAYIEDNAGLAYGDAGYYGTYQATTAGTLTISFDYRLAYDVQADANEETTA